MVREPFVAREEIVPAVVNAVERSCLKEEIRISGWRSREKPWIRCDPNAPKVEAIGVPTDPDGGIVSDLTLVVPGARVDQELEAHIFKINVPLGTQHPSEFSCPKAVLGIAILVEPLRVVDERKEQDQLRVAALYLRNEWQSSRGDSLPVLLPVIARNGSPRPRDDQLSERRIHVPRP